MSGGLVPGPGGEIVRRSRGLAARGLDLAERMADARGRTALAPSPGAFRSVALSADGGLLVAARSGFSSARGLLVVALDGSGAVHEGLGEEWVRAVRFLGGGADLVAATQAGDVVQLRLERDGLREVARRRCPAGPSDPPRAVCAARDGGFVAVLLGTATLVGLPWPDGEAWAFDLGREVGDASGRRACAFEPAPAGKLAVVGDRVLVFDRSGSGGRLASLEKALASGPAALRWSGNELLAVDGRELIRFPLLGGRPVSRALVSDPAAEVGRAAISPGGNVVALDLASHAGVVDLYESSGRLLERRPAHARGVEALAVGDDGLLAVADADGRLTVWAPAGAGEPLLRIGERAADARPAIAAR